MITDSKHEVTHYLHKCYYSIKQQACKMAFTYYQNLELDKLAVQYNSEMLNLLCEQVQVEAEQFDRPLYLEHFDDLRFLVDYFTTEDRYFGVNEQGKYLQAQFIVARKRLLQHLVAINDIQIEILMLEQSQFHGEPDLDRMNYLQARLEMLLRQDVLNEQRHSQPTAVRGPRKKYTFGFYGSAELLTRVVDDLTMEIGYLRFPTTTADFVKVVTSPDLTSENIFIYMGCKNSQIIYTMEYFDTMFLSFKPCTISNYGHFISKRGTVFNSHNLGNTVITHINKRYAIDAIFKKYNIARVNADEHRLKMTETRN